MTDLPLEHDDDVTRPVEEPDGSVWAQLRAEHEELSQEREPLELDVPGYSGLVVRYRYVPLRDTEASTKRLQKVRSVTEQTLYAAIDTLILACDEVLVRLPSGVRPLADEGQPPVQFDHRLAEGMGWEPNMKARTIVYKLFGGKQGEYRIIEQAQEVSSWMSTEREVVSDEFVEG